MDADAGAGSLCDEVYLAAGIAWHGDLSGDGSLVGGCRGGDGVDIGVGDGEDAGVSSNLQTQVREPTILVELGRLFSNRCPTLTLPQIRFASRPRR